MSIVRNNLGNVYTLEARALANSAAIQRQRNNHTDANGLIGRATEKYEDACANFRLAIEDAEIVITEAEQMGLAGALPPSSSTFPHKKTWKLNGEHKEEKEPATNHAPRTSTVDALDSVENQRIDRKGPQDDEMMAALTLQLANRKFNLALCLAAKVADDPHGEKITAKTATDEARRLIHECETLAAGRTDAFGSERRVESLLTLAALEHAQPGRAHEAATALDIAESIISGSCRQRNTTFAFTPLTVLRQRLLAARGENSLAAGQPEVAVEYWTEAIIGCGDLMDTGVVRSSLIGLRAQVKYLDGHRTDYFPETLVRSLGLSKDKRKEDLGGESNAVCKASLAKAIDGAIRRLGGNESLSCTAIRVDLCFVMDCTESVSENNGQNSVQPYRWRLKNQRRLDTY